MLKSVFSRITLKDEVQGTLSRLERERIQHYLALIELDGKRGIIESKITWLKGWMNPPPQTLPAQTPNESTKLAEKSE